MDWPRALDFSGRTVLVVGGSSGIGQTLPVDGGLILS